MGFFRMKPRFYRGLREIRNFPLDIVRDNPVTSHFPEYPLKSPHNPPAPLKPLVGDVSSPPTERIHNV